MQIYNAGGLDNNQRFLRAILTGLAAGIGMGILYGLIFSFIRIELEILYLLIGWCIGMAIQKVSHGVGTRYCVVGAISTLLAIIIGDLFAVCLLNGNLSLMMQPAVWPQLLTYWVRMHLATSINNLLGILFRIAGIYFGYHYSSLF